MFEGITTPTEHEMYCVLYVHFSVPNAPLVHRKQKPSTPLLLKKEQQATTYLIAPENSICKDIYYRCKENYL